MPREALPAATNRFESGNVGTVQSFAHGLLVNKRGDEEEDEENEEKKENEDSSSSNLLGSRNRITAVGDGITEERRKTLSVLAGKLSEDRSSISAGVSEDLREEDKYRASEERSSSSSGVPEDRVEEDRDRRVRTFPPPLSSLARKSLWQFPSRMPLVSLEPIRSHGRFVLQERKLPKPLIFRPIRINGRLILQRYGEEDDDLGKLAELNSGNLGSSRPAAAATSISSSATLLGSSSSSSPTSTSPSSASPTKKFSAKARVVAAR